MQMHLNFITFYICFLASAKRPFHFRECRIVQLFVLSLEIIQVSDSIAWVRCDFFNREAFPDSHKSLVTILMVNSMANLVVPEIGGRFLTKHGLLLCTYLIFFYFLLFHLCYKQYFHISICSALKVKP